MHDKVFHRLHESGEFPLAEIVRSLSNLKVYLATKVYRQTAIDLHR